MPEMNGIEATRTMVSHHPDVVVILCSTYDASDLPPEVATSGARAYLNKEHLGADTLRRAVGTARRERVHVGLTLLSDQRDRAADLRALPDLRTPSAPFHRSHQGGLPC